ncbi:MAG: hypothetical protein QNJ51_07285 [Calothrix sp. MO_167.B12]|nr:hypothetical protein [Calothrix sp. MO_167.B12]
MSETTNGSNIVQAIAQVPQKVFNFITTAFVRIFSPRDDDYPETGVQPFEGEPADKQDY